MDNIFLSVINMSLTATYIIPFILIARLILKKSPKVYSYVLWSVVLFRLLCPFSIESVLSLLPEEKEPITRSTIIADIPTISTGMTIIDQSINPILPPAPQIEEVGNSINPMQIWILIAEIIWVNGTIIMTIIALISIIRLKRKLIVCREIEKGIFIADDISSPFIFGLISPKIYLPSSILDNEFPMILAHEKYHIKRFDHITRFLSFIALSLHWFNPLVWVAYYISEKDMEASCDEGVLKGKNIVERGEYATILLKFTNKRLNLTPIAFSEGDTKERVKNIMKMKKTKIWVSLVSITLVGCLLIACGTDNTEILDVQNTNNNEENLIEEDIQQVPEDEQIVSEYQSVGLIFPASEQGKTEFNSAIYEITPFGINFILPNDLTIEEHQITENDDSMSMLPLFSKYDIKNTQGDTIGTVGYTVYEASEEIPQAIYNQIALGNNYNFDIHNSYNIIKESENGVTATVDVHYSASVNNGEDLINHGIVAYDREKLVYVAFEFDSKHIANEIIETIANSLEIVETVQPNTEAEIEIEDEIETVTPAENESNEPPPTGEDGDVSLLAPKENIDYKIRVNLPDDKTLENAKLSVSMDAIYPPNTIPNSGDIDVKSEVITKSITKSDFYDFSIPDMRTISDKDYKLSFVLELNTPFSITTEAGERIPSTNGRIYTDSTALGIDIDTTDIFIDITDESSYTTESSSTTESSFYDTSNVDYNLHIEISNDTALDDATVGIGMSKVKSDTPVPAIGDPLAMGIFTNHTISSEGVTTFSVADLRTISSYDYELSFAINLGRPFSISTENNDFVASVDGAIYTTSTELGFDIDDKDFYITITLH